MTLILALALALCLAAEPPGESPGELHLAAFVSITQRVKIEHQRDVRYLSLAGVPPKERNSFVRDLDFVLNSVSWRSKFGHVLPIGPALVVVDLKDFGWDRASRAERIARLKSQGVDTSTFKADLWEEFAAKDPFYFTTSARGVRGWLDPAADEALRSATYASKALLSAPWLLPKLLLEKEDGGFYSQALLLPPREADLYKTVGVDQKFVDADPSLKAGGATLASIVAIHNRELQLIPSLYGYDDRFIWRTFDFNRDDTGDKSVLDALAGSVRHDGREVIGTLPNGLHWYYLADGKGTQVNVVPQTIALDMRTPRPDKDPNVRNSYKCISCHGPVSGIYPFDDVVGKAILAPGIGLAVLSKDAGQLAPGAAAIEDYYLSNLKRRMGRQQQSYADRVQECNGAEPGPNSLSVVSWVDRYIHDLVSPEQAALEMGRPLDAARVLWRNGGNSQLAILGTGQPIRRAAWEAAWKDAMLADHYPWDK